MAYISADREQRESFMTKQSELLIKYGFILAQDENGSNPRKKYRYDADNGTFSPKEGGKIDSDHALMEFAEDILLNAPYQTKGMGYVPTGYPAPLKRFHILYESFNTSIEENYFWLVDHMRYDQGFNRIFKVRDVFTATENSAFFGASQQRLGAQQDRVQQYLATIGKMIKDLFQIIRELRILDEKLQPRKDWRKSKSADITLKAEYIDLVENRGGQTSPSSVYGMAQQLGYAALPDLFFNTHLYTLEEIDKEVDKLGYNKNVQAVVKRKLYQFVNWKLKTDHELESRRTFTLKYLRQHWDIIQMYLNWVKPYLRHIARLQMNEDKLNEVDLIGAFEQSMIETEVLFAKPMSGDAKKIGMFEVVLITINFRTRPQMNYQQEGYQRGPSHSGQADIFWRGYHWSDDHIQNYLRYRREEDLYMLGVVDRSVMAAMEALGDELEKYLAEAGEPKYKDRLEKERKKEEARLKKEAKESGMFIGVLEPFKNVGSGLNDLFGFTGLKGMFAGGFSKAKKKEPKFPDSLASLGGKGMSKNLQAQLYQCVKNYKKAHGMLSWG